MNTVTGLLLILMTAFTPLMASARVTYLAVVGPGTGQGMFGHVFLVITESEGQFLNSKAFQYSIRVPVNSGPMDLATGLGKFPFILEQRSGWDFIKGYSKDQRTVLLYQLNLNDEQIAKIEASLNEDKELRARQPQFDYDVKANNCATKIYDHINSVVPATLSLSYVTPMQGFYKLQFYRSKDISLVIPLSAAPVLQNHPLIKGLITFRLKNLIDIEVAMTAMNNLKPLFEKCGTDPKVRTVLGRMYGNQTLREGEKYLPLFRGLFQSCVTMNPEMREVYNDHIEFVRMGTDDQKFLAWAAGFYITYN